MNILKNFKKSFLNIKIADKFFFVVVFWAMGLAAIAYAHTLVSSPQDYRFYAVVVAVFFITTLVLRLVVVNGIINPISGLQTVINNVAAGNIATKVQDSNNDEIGKLANTFYFLIRVQSNSLAKAEQERQQLNTSIITLLRSVSLLSQKDLTVKIPVAQDMTGAISDSINLLTKEIAVTLQEVAHISARVYLTSGKVKQQSGNVMLFSDTQSKEIATTLEMLDAAVNTMSKIAQFSQLTHKEVKQHILTTESAEEKLAKLIVSIKGIQDIIRETEKKLKRLGDCSHEITRAVNMINKIAERTQILSLNAGMQAASAGEVGRAFMELPTRCKGWLKIRTRPVKKFLL